VRLIAEVAFGYSITSASPVWTDITQHVDMLAGISIERGAQDELSETQPGTASLVLDNADGRFTSDRTSSPYYPNVKKNVPIRLRVVTADRNLITNPSFESGLADWAPSATPTIAQSATRAKVGTQSCLMTFGGVGVDGQSAHTTVYGLDIGTTYTASAWVWVPAGGTHVHLRVEGAGEGAPSTLTDTWQRITVTWTATATQHPLRVHSFTTPTAGHQVWIDAVQVWEGTSPLPLNLIGNSSFETDTSGWVSSGSPTLSRSAVRAHHGVGSLLVTWPGTAGTFAATTIGNLVSGTTYTASAYVWVPAGHPAVELRIAGVVSGAASTATDAWQRITVTWTATATSHELRIQAVTTPTAGQQVWVDAAQVEEGAAPSAYTPLDGAQIHPRYVGMVNSWPVKWQGLQSKVTVTCTDVFKWSDLERELLPMLSQEILLDRPIAYYPLTEASDAASAGDLSGTAGVGTLAVTQAGTGGTLEFGAGTGPNGCPAPVFTPSSTSNGRYLSADLGQSMVDANVNFRARIEAWFSTSTNGRVLLALASTDASTRVVVLLESGTGKLALEKDQGGNGTQSYVFPTPNLADGKLHHLVYNEFSNDLVIDGTTYNLFAYNGTDMRMLTVGGYAGSRLWSGTISHVAVYCRSITATELAGHYTTGTTAHVGESASARMARIASYVGLSVTAQGATFDPMASQAQLGQSALTHMREIETTESGKLLASRASVGLIFQSRGLRYNPTPAVTLAFADLETDDLDLLDDDQKMVNTVVASRPEGATQRIVNQAAVDTYGPKPRNLTLLKTSDNSVADASNWLISRYADPPPEIRQVPVQAYSLPLATYRALLDADVSTVLGLTSLPEQAPAPTATLVVEGYSERISAGQHLLDFHTSRAQTDSVWFLDDPTYSVLGSTTRLAY
jgi:hypothetical protein